MKRQTLTVCLLALGTFFCCQSSFGQSAVQLPVFSGFGVGTTVTVPDRGGMLLGGVSRAREGSVTRGLPLISKLPGLSRLGKNHAIGREFSRPTMSVHATIIDLNELDEMVLAQARSRAMNDIASQASNAEAARLSSHVSSASSLHVGSSRPSAAKRPTVVAATTRSTPPSVAELRRRSASVRDAKYAEAMQYFRKAEDAEAKGKRTLAKIYYQMAGRRGDQQLQALVTKRLLAFQ